MNKTFVFVVCGAKEHLDTLNFSLKALRKYVDLPILIVTDLNRNEAKIDHPTENIIDVRVNEEYNHHQASIYLKTGLHKFLPMGDHLYCYLDTDVVALNMDASKIFDHYTTPVTFATDHCKMNAFSPQAIHCSCAQMPDELQTLIDGYAKKFKPLMKNQALVEGVIDKWRGFKKKYPLEQAKNEWFDGLLEGRTELQAKRAKLLKLTHPQLSKPQLLYNYVFRVLPNFRRSLGIKQWKDLKGNVLLDEGPDYHLFMNERGFFFDKGTKRWLDTKGQPVPEIPKVYDEFLADHKLCLNSSEEAWYTTTGELLLPNITKLIENNSTYWHDSATDTWYNEHDNRVFANECNHLKDAIKSDFEVEITQTDWQHWNGGVFLFDKNSIAFLDTWHKLTLSSFSLPNWKTRDQGTLITTAWKFGLQNQAVLPAQFNFIADYYHPTMAYEGNLKFRLRASAPTISPSFIHIYHHWGDTSWAVWNDVENHVMKKS